MPSFEWNLFTQPSLSGTKFARKKLETLTYAIVWQRFGVSVSPVLGSVPHRDRQTDGQTVLRQLIRTSNCVR